VLVERTISNRSAGGLTRFLLPAMATSPNFRKTAHSNRSISFTATALLLGTWFLWNFSSKFGPEKRVMAGGPALTSDSDTIAVKAAQKNLTIKQKINEQIQDNK